MKTEKTMPTMPKRVMLTCLSVITAIGVIAAGCAIAANPAEAAKAKITKAEAKKIALADANVTAKAATFEKITTDTENGVKVYEVDFRAGKYDYDYDIAIRGGKIIEKDKDLVKSVKAKVKKSNKGKKASGYIGKKKAREIAFKHAGVTKAKVKKLKVEMETDDGIKIYEVDFKAGNWDYDYDINAKTGKIVDVDKEKIHKVKKSSTAKYPITKAEAKRIALAHAGLSASKVKGLKASIDYEDGIKVWEVEFDKGKWEYEYDISVKTGKIVDWDKEYDD